MTKRLISICIVAILLCDIYQYFQNEEMTSIKEPVADIEAVEEEISIPIWNMSESVGESTGIISSGWYKYFLEQQEHISNISNGQCSYESIVEMMSEIRNEVLLTLIIKEHLQNNDLSGFTFQELEKAFCYYMGTARYFPNMYAFAVCKEVLNGDIV